MRKIFLLFIIIFSAQLFAEKVRLKAHWYPQSQFAGYIMAYEKGFFKDAGLDVDLVFSKGTDLPLEELMQDKVDYCTAWLSQAISFSQDNEIVNICQLLQNSSLMIVARKSSGINKPEDLNGRKVSFWEGNFSVPFQAFINKHQLQFEKLPSTYNIDMFLAGACDATSVMYYNEYNKIYLAGIDFDSLTTIFFSADKDLNYPEDGIYVTKEYFEKNKDECLKMRKAILDGWKYALENQKETIDTVLAYCERSKLKTNRSQQKWMLDVILKSLVYQNENHPEKWGVLSTEDYFRVAKELKKQGFIKDIIEFEEFYRGTDHDKN